MPSQAPPYVLQRAQGALLGQIAGDSLGSLVEFQGPAEIEKRYPNGPRLLEDGGTWSTLAGQATDDSELALALARAIVSAGFYSKEAAACAYADWYDSGPFDKGKATSTALSAASRGRSTGEAAAFASAAADPVTQANGALMRISPLGIFGAFLPLREQISLARVDAGLTHPHPICRDANAIFVAAIAFAIRTGASALETYEYALETALKEAMLEPIVDRLQRAAKHPPANYVRQQGWVLTALHNAFYQLHHAASLEEGVVQTVRAGGDTDTNGAIAGALLGAAYGRGSIPAQWINRVVTCRPLAGLSGVKNPRPARYWPIDALALAERLLVASVERRKG